MEARGRSRLNQVGHFRTPPARDAVMSDSIWKRDSENAANLRDLEISSECSDREKEAGLAACDWETKKSCLTPGKVSGPEV